MRAHAWIAVILATAFVCAARAADYPAHPIRLIVPFTPGGIVDIVARITAESLSRELGQAVVIDNRPGAGGTVGMYALAAQAPDGYVLGLATTGPLAIAPALTGIDAPNLTSISLLATSAQVLIVHPSLPAKSLRELVTYARHHPDEIAYASAGIGTTGHLAGALFESLADIDLLHVPYSGNQAALRDVLAGRVQVLLSPLPPVLTYIRDGKLRALAIAGPVRSRSLPEVPTIAESGWPGAEAEVWYGLVAPAKTPRVIVDALRRALHKAMTDGAFARGVLDAGADPGLSTPEAFARLIEDDRAKWKRVIDARAIGQER